MQPLRHVGKIIIVAILRIEASIVLKRYKPYIIGVTGSVGKTSTKDIIYSILHPHYRIRKSHKSFNSEIGLPLTILGLSNAWDNPIEWLRVLWQGLLKCIIREPYPTHLVLELGVDHPGDMQSIVNWLPLDIAIMNRIGAVPVHVEFFPSAQALAREKALIFKALKPQGVAIISIDDPEVREVAPKGITLKTYGFDQGAQVRGLSAEMSFDAHNVPQGTRIKALYGNKDSKEEITIDLAGVLGTHHAYPVLAGLAVAEVLNISASAVIASLALHRPPAGRMRILRGVKDSIVIDDSYNSSPDALREALRTLASIQVAGRKIAVIGDMLELGKHTQQTHRDLGRVARESARLVVTVGVRAKAMEGQLHFANSVQAAQALPNMIEERDVILVKGSQGARMEHIVKALLADSSQAGELVRQEPEWQAR